MAEKMSDTALTEENVFCPEIFVRSISIEIRRQVNLALSRIEEIETALAAATASPGAKKGGVS